MRVLYNNDGVFVNYSIDGATLTFRGGEVVLDLAEMQRDYPVNVTISEDREGRLVTGASWRYIAEVEIPARLWVIEKTGVADDIGFPVLRKLRQPIDMERVALTLWGVERGAR
jgi:hypothetical protein